MHNIADASQKFTWPVVSTVGPALTVAVSVTMEPDVADVTTLQFYSQDPQFKGSIGCGPINLKAYVYYKSLPGQTRFAGNAVGVELAK